MPIIKAVRVKSKEEISNADALPCDMLLLDTYSEAAYGGTGKSFDYSLIPSISKPFFLAGGLNTENVGNALVTSAFCLDISSGVEENGFKSEEKIKTFIERIRNHV